MKLRIIGVALCLSISISASVAEAAGKLSDSQIVTEMLGAWIVPESSTDFREDMLRILETYRADGTYSTDFFNDAACTKLKVRVVSLWSIKNGMMTSIYPNGRHDVDDVVSIRNDTLTLHSHEDGTTYTRVRAASCGIPAS